MKQANSKQRDVSYFSSPVVARADTRYPCNYRAATSRVEAYTDGACSENPGGPGSWACVLRLFAANGTLVRETQASGTHPETTSNRMEIQAAIEALRRVNRPCDVLIVSDSRYLVETMRRGWKRKKNQDLWVALDAQVGKQHRVRWRWVRGHNGNRLNERAHVLAGIAQDEFLDEWKLMTDETEKFADAEYPHTWRPDQGDPPRIKGKIVSVTRSPDFGWGPFPIITLETSEGQQSVFCMHSVLRRELAERQPQRGDEIEIVYLGMKQPKGNGKPYHSYQVVGGAEQDYDWNQDLPDDERRQMQADRQAQSAQPPITPSEPAAWVEPKPELVKADGEQFGDEPPFVWKPESWDGAKFTAWNHFA